MNLGVLQKNIDCSHGKCMKFAGDVAEKKGGKMIVFTKIREIGGCSTKVIVYTENAFVFYTPLIRIFLVRNFHKPSRLFFKEWNFKHP